ncbi:MAG: rhombosortase [Gammaproteobacteria bacterium]|nr:rhombosortase [Gammaproteobacteria bacterium]
MTHQSKIVRTLTHPAYLYAAALVVFCVLLQWLGYSDSWRFDQQAIAKGHWWLLLSGNFVHLGMSHLGMNMAGLVLIVALVWAHFSVWEWALITLVSSITVGLGLYFFDPDVLWYVGFSGSLHGLLIAGCLADLKHYPKSAGLLLLLTVLKLAYEQWLGPVPGSESVAGGSVVVNSHLYGALGGAVMGALLLAWRLRR